MKCTYPSVSSWLVIFLAYTARTSRNQTKKIKAIFRRYSLRKMTFLQSFWKKNPTKPDSKGTF